MNDEQYSSTPMTLGRASAQVSQQPMVFDKTAQLRNILSDIAERLQPIMLQSSESDMKKPMTDIPLHRELDSLIDMALTIKNAIVL